VTGWHEQKQYGENLKSIHYFNKELLALMEKIKKKVLER